MESVRKFQACPNMQKAGLSTLPHFAGDSRILSIYLPHGISNLPHREEEEFRIKKISLAFLDPETFALKVKEKFIHKCTCLKVKMSSKSSIHAKGKLKCQNARSQKCFL